MEYNSSTTILVPFEVPWFATFGLVFVACDTHNPLLCLPETSLLPVLRFGWRLPLLSL